MASEIEIRLGIKDDNITKIKTKLENTLKELQSVANKNPVKLQITDLKTVLDTLKEINKVNKGIKINIINNNNVTDLKSQLSQAENIFENFAKTTGQDISQELKDSILASLNDPNMLNKLSENLKDMVRKAKEEIDNANRNSTSSRKSFRNYDYVEDNTAIQSSNFTGLSDFEAKLNNLKNKIGDDGKLISTLITVDEVTNKIVSAQLKYTDETKKTVNEVWQWAKAEGDLEESFRVKTHTYAENQEAYNKAIENTKNKLRGLEQQLTKIESSAELNSYFKSDQKALEDFKNEIATVGARLESLKDKEPQLIDDKEIIQTQDEIKDLNRIMDSYIDKIKEAKRVETLGSKIDAYSGDNFTIDTKATEDEIKTMVKAISEGKAEVNDFGKVVDKGGKSFREIVIRQKDSNNQWKYSKVLVDDYNRSVSVSNVKMRDVLNRQISFTEALKTAYQKFAIWSVATVSWYAMINAIKTGVKYIMDLDNALNQIRIVTGRTETQVKQLGLTYNKIAKEMSVSTKEVTQQAVELYRQGLGDTGVEERMMAIIKYAKVSGLSLEQSNKIITATMNATGESAQKVIDIFALLGDKTASGADEIGEALQKVAGTAESMAVSIEKASAWIATISSKTRESASVIGNSLKSMMARYAQIKESGYTSEDATKLNDVVTALHEAGIEALDSNKQLRNFGDVVDELMVKWGELGKRVDGENLKRRIATAFGGTYQLNRFLVLMDNADDAMENYKLALNSIGSANQKFQIYQDSTKASLDRLTASWEEFWMRTINSSAIKGVINFLSSLLNLLSKVGTVIPIIAGIVGGVLTYAIIHFTGGLKALNVELLKTSALTAGLPLLIGIIVTVLTGFIYHVVTTSNKLNTLNKEQKELINNFEEQKKSVDKSTESLEGQAKVAETLKEKIEELNNKKGDLTETEKIQMGVMVEQINNILPNLNLLIDSQTGKIINNTSAIEDNIKALRNQAIAQAYQQKANLAGTAYVEQKGVISETEKARQKALDEYNKIDSKKKQAIKELKDLSNGKNLTSDDIVKKTYAIMNKYGVDTGDLELINNKANEIEGYNKLLAEQNTKLNDIDGELKDYLDKANDIKVEEVAKTNPTDKPLVINNVFNRETLKKLYQADKIGIKTYVSELNKIMKSEYSEFSGKSAKDINGMLLDGTKKVKAEQYLDLLQDIKSAEDKGNKTNNYNDIDQDPKALEKDRYFQLNTEIDKYNSAIDLNKAKQENATLIEKVKLMKDEVDLYKKLQGAVSNKAKEERKERDEIANYFTSIKNGGVTKKGSGDSMELSGAFDLIEKARKSANADPKNKDKKDYYEYLKQQFERFVEIQQKEIPSLQKDWASYQKTIGDTADEMENLVRQNAKELIEIQKKIDEHEMKDRLKQKEETIFAVSEAEYNAYKKAKIAELEKEKALAESLKTPQGNETARLLIERINAENDLQYADITDFSKIYEDIHQQKIDAIQDEIDALDKKNDIEQEELERSQKQLEITELTNKLQNLQNNKNVQTLKKMADGSWNYEYVADQEEIDEVNKELKSKITDFAQWEKDLKTKNRKEELEAQKEHEQDLIRLSKDTYDLISSQEEERLRKHYEDMDTLVEEKMEELRTTFGAKWDLILGDLDTKLRTAKEKLAELISMSNQVPDAGTSEFTANNNEKARLQQQLLDTIRERSVTFDINKIASLDSLIEVLKRRIASMDTGGYTGDFSGGKLALLHEKELVLNKFDTSNLLKAVNITRDFISNFKIPEFSFTRNNPVGQVFNISKLEFPNATNADEIKRAILGLPMLSLQYNS